MSNEFPPHNANDLFDPPDTEMPHVKMLDVKGGTHQDLGDINFWAFVKHLQTAILLELKTIPPYLYAAYSIKVSGPAKWSILNVAQQEMLHLALAGNILCALGGKPKLYSLNPPGSKTFPEFPSYPDKMFYQETPLNLRGATKPNIRTFLELEQPSMLKDQPEEALNAYGSLGTFYWAIGEGYSQLGDGAFFLGNKKKQLRYGDGSWYNDEMVAVTDLKSAMRALAIIIDQGEGSQRAMSVQPTGSLDPPAPFAVKSHFEIFQDIYKGPPLDHYDVFVNPKTENFKTSYPSIYKVLLVGDAAYCYLLLTIETLWKTTEKADRMHFVNNNLHNIMLKVLRPLTTFLLPKTGKVNPSDKEQHFNLFFNYYAFGGIGKKLAQLKELTSAAVAANPNDKILPEVKVVVDALEDVEK